VRPDASPSSGRAPSGGRGPDPLSLPRLLAGAGNPSLESHFRRWGQMPGGSRSLVDEIEKAGLRGRGGAQFPTATKLRAVAYGRRRVVVANGTEGEPASSKDKALMVSSPHLVLDGASIAAETIGAGEAIICIDRSASEAVAAIRGALAERLPAGADRIALRVETTPSRYLTGEESALVHWLNGGGAKPTFVPPRPFERGVGGRPTLVSNVETLAHLALIARFGAGWFRSLGSADDPGTALITFTGDVARPGVYELPLGVPLFEALRVAGVSGPPQALLIGGYAGTWVPGSDVAGARLGRDSLRGVGASLGCGAISVLGAKSCGLATSAQVARWLASQSAGQCGPCANGLPAIATSLEALVAGDRNSRQEQQLRRWVDMVDGRGACHHPDGAARLVRSALSVFGEEVARHRRRGQCTAPGLELPLPELEVAWQ
jgi:NADH:ubiquinone oxidoreductase subunit F (NADH-binding)